jgi:hypothetical protein
MFVVVVIKVKVKLSLCFSWAPRHEGVLGECKYSSIHRLTSALDGGKWSASRPGRFIPRERAPGTHWRGGWMGPRAVLDAVVKRKIPSPRTPIVQPVVLLWYPNWNGNHGNIKYYEISLFTNSQNWYQFSYTYPTAVIALCWLQFTVILLIFWKGDIHHQPLLIRWNVHFKFIIITYFLGLVTSYSLVTISLLNY